MTYISKGFCPLIINMTPTLRPSGQMVSNYNYTVGSEVTIISKIFRLRIIDILTINEIRHLGII